MDRRHMSIVAAVAVLIAAQPSNVRAGLTGAQGRGQGTAAPTPARDATTTPQQPATGSAEISGTVTLAGGSAPIRRAQVSLSAQAIRNQRTIVTDDKGHFAFTSLPTGRYSLSASKPGYVTTTYGAKKAGRPGTPIQLADGQKFDRATILMPKGSVLTGIVVDEANEPTPGTQVRAYRYVMRTGEKSLQQDGSASTDDRGVYRIYGLQPGDYLVSATPRSLNLSDVRQSVMAQVDQLLQQAQALNATDPQGGGGAGGGGRGGAQGAGNPGRGAGGGRGQALIDQANQLQQQLAQQEKEQTVGYAPVYYPGTTNPATAAPITLNVGEEHGGVDLQLLQVPTAIVAGSVASPDGRLPQGVLIMLRPMMTPGSPTVPNLSDQAANARVLADGTFSFSNVAPGQYTVSARATIRETDPTQAIQPNAPNGRGRGAFGGPGGRGPGVISSVLWASADVTVNGQNITGLALALAAGMSVSGRVEFRGGSLPPPTDLTRVRVTLSSQDPQTQQPLGGGMGLATVDASGNFTIAGVPPGRYVLRANAPAGGGVGGLGGTSSTAPTGTTGSWSLKSSTVDGRDSLDFPFVVKPGVDVTGALLSFVDHNQTLKGTLQDATGRPTADYTIIVFAADKTYWTPQSRRIASARPGTDGSYTTFGLPPGDYRITAVVDVEQGEWFDPDFLTQLLPASIPVSIAEGETKTQDLKLAGGGI
jgi:uncharacterized protein (DUF2141 family)